jgi:hypothetical protein
MTIPLIVRNFGIEKYGIFTRAKCYSCSYFVWGGWLNQCILRFNNFSSSFKVMIFHLYLIIFIPLSLVCFILLKFLEIVFFSVLSEL